MILVYDEHYNPGIGTLGTSGIPGIPGTPGHDIKFRLKRSHNKSGFARFFARKWMRVRLTFHMVKSTYYQRRLINFIGHKRHLLYINASIIPNCFPQLLTLTISYFILRQIYLFYILYECFVLLFSHDSIQIFSFNIAY